MHGCTPTGQVAEQELRFLRFSSLSEMPKNKRKKPAKRQVSSDADSEYEYEEEPVAKKKPRSTKVTSEAVNQAVAYFHRTAEPPATISLATAEVVHLSASDRAHWCTEAGGQSRLAG